ncbi:MAG: alpha/beta hydrolase [Actinomycetales bacterium]|nr:MAG: alpha/beta hydrolase [Actinomycetales bacterium]
MRPPRPKGPSLLGMGIGMGAAASAGAAGTAGLIADRIRRREDAQLPEYRSLTQPADHELAVTSYDGVVLHAQIDEPTGNPIHDNGVPKPTVVLSHGYCLSSECWVLQRRALKKAGYRVVTWDQRGHGKSDKGDPASYDIEKLGLDLLAVIDAAAPEGQLALGGHSMGGMTIMAMAGHHPEIVTERTVAFAAVATSPGGIPLANGGFAATAGKVVLERMGPGVFTRLSRQPKLLQGLLRANRELSEFAVERYSFGSPVPRSVVQLTAKMLLNTDLTVISDFVPTFDKYDMAGNLGFFAHVETLVFNGMQDVLTPPDHSRLLVDAIPGAEHVMLHDAGHIIMLEHPDLLNEQLLALLERAAVDQALHLDPADKPHVTTVVTPVGKKRAVRKGLTHRRRKPQLVS